MNTNASYVCEGIYTVLSVVCIAYCSCSRNVCNKFCGYLTITNFSDNTLEESIDWSCSTCRCRNSCSWSNCLCKSITNVNIGSRDSSQNLIRLGINNSNSDSVCPSSWVSCSNCYVGNWIVIICKLLIMFSTLDSYAGCWTNICIFKSRSISDIKIICSRNSQSSSVSKIGWCNHPTLIMLICWIWSAESV